MKHHRWPHLLFVVAALASATAFSDDLVKVETALSGLSNPCGVAIQPETHAVFISDTDAGQIVKLGDTPNKSTPVITGFPQSKDAQSKEPTYSVGPLGLAFLSQNILITGEGALKQGDEVVRVFDLPADGKTQTFDDARQKLAPTSDPPSKTTDPGNFFGFTVASNAMLVTAYSDGKAVVLKADVKTNSSLEELKPFIQNKANTKIDALLGIAFSNHGFLVLGPRNETDKSTGGKQRSQSQLAFYNVKNGNLLMSLPTELHDITGLAYSPKTGRLYALDFAWDDPSHGGLYRLDAAAIDGRSGVKAVKLTALDKPSDMAFTPANVLYVTEFGSLPTDPKTNKPPKPGKLLKITGDL